MKNVLKNIQEIIKENPCKSDMEKFAQHVASTMVNNVLDKEKISKAPDVDRQDFITAISQLYSKRLNQYFDLIKIESENQKAEVDM